MPARRSPAKNDVSTIHAFGAYSHCLRFAFSVWLPWKLGAGFRKSAAAHRRRRVVGSPERCPDLWRLGGNARRLCEREYPAASLRISDPPELSRRLFG